MFRMQLLVQASKSKVKNANYVFCLISVLPCSHKLDAGKKIFSHDEADAVHVLREHQHICVCFHLRAEGGRNTD